MLSDTNLPINHTPVNEVNWTEETDVLTIVYPFADRLQYFHVDCGSTAIVAIVLVFILADDPCAPLEHGELLGGASGNSRNNGTSVERHDRGIHVDFVGMKDSRVGQRR